MMVVFQGILDEIPPFEKYWTHMFQNKYMLVVGECHSKVLHSLDFVVCSSHQSMTQTKIHLL